MGATTTSRIALLIISIPRPRFLLRLKIRGSDSATTARPAVSDGLTISPSQPHLADGVLVEGSGQANVAAKRLHGAVTGLGGDRALRGAGRGSRSREASSQRMVRQMLRVHLAPLRRGPGTGGPDHRFGHSRTPKSPVTSPPVCLFVGYESTWSPSSWPWLRPRPTSTSVASAAN
jgi:hypothetical protein